RLGVVEDGDDGADLLTGLRVPADLEAVVEEQIGQALGAVSGAEDEDGAFQVLLGGGVEAVEFDRLRQAEALGHLLQRSVDEGEIGVFHAASTIAVSPWPPAAQIETSDLFLPGVLRCLAVVAMMRPPVAAKGWPAARLDPSGLSLSRSMRPWAASTATSSIRRTSDS